MSGRWVNSKSAIMGIGRARLRMTWLMTSALVALTPRPTTTNAGAMVTSRRTQIGISEANEALHDHLAGHGSDRRARDTPEARREIKKTVAAPAPSRGSNVW